MKHLKTFEIILNSNPNIFYPGQCVDGKCIIETNSEITCKFLKIKMKGVAKVDWKEGRDYYLNEECYFNYKQILQENSNFIYFNNYFKND